MKVSQVIAAKANLYARQHGLLYQEGDAMARQLHPDLAVLDDRMQPHKAYRNGVALANEKKAPTQAAQKAFLARVEEVRREMHMPYIEAFNYCQRNETALANDAGLVEAVAAAGTGVVRSGDNYVPNATDETCAALGLPSGSNLDVVEAAWCGNGKRFKPFNAAAVFQSLATLIETKEGLSPEQAIERAKARWPLLWRLVLDAGK